MDLFDLFFSGSEVPNLKIAYWVGGVGVALGAFCIFSRHAYCLIFKLWNAFIRFIDLCITWTTLPFFYYFLLTPFAFVLRIFGKTSMKKTNPQCTTFWRKSNSSHISQAIPSPILIMKNEDQKNFEEISEQNSVGLIKELLLMLKHNKKWWLTLLFSFFSYSVL